MSEEKKQKLYQKEYQKNIVRLKKQNNFFLSFFFSLYKNEKRIVLQ